MTQDNQQPQDQLKELRARYLQSLPEKLAQLRITGEQLRAEGHAGNRLRELMHEAHNLAGNGATFGCHEISGLARALYLVCETLRKNAQPALIEQVEHLITRLSDATRHTVERANKALAARRHPGTYAMPPADAPCVLIADDDGQYAENMASHVRAAGYSAQVITDLGDLAQAVAKRRPHAILMDMVFQRGRLEGADAALLYAKQHHIPVVCVSVRGDVEARLAAIRAGASHYLTKPVDSARVIAALDRLMIKPGTRRYRILLVDDDIDWSALYRKRFESGGMETLVVNNPVDALDTLKSTEPDLIVLDIDMPDINGLELGALIRQQEEYNHIPIVFLSAEATTQNQLAGMHLGGDDFINKTIAPDLLVEAIRARAMRARDLRDGRLSLQLAMNHLEFMQQVLDEHAIVAMTDLDGKILFANQRFCEISGYATQELLGQNHRVLKSGLHGPEFYADLWETISSGHVWRGILANRAKDGRLYDVATTIVPKLDDAGLPEQYVSIHTDISALKEMERRLIEREELLRSIVDTAPICIKLMDPAGRVLKMNAAGLAMIESDTPEQAIGTEMAALVVPEHRAAFIQSLEDVKLGASRTLEFDIIGFKGTRRAVHAEAVPLRKAGETEFAILSVSSDITERKRAEAENIRLQARLRQSQKMESIGHLTAGIAHDFNNLLGGILGFAELSSEFLERMNSADTDCERVGKYLSQIISAGNRAKELIAQMLVFSRLDPDIDGKAAPPLLLQPMVKEVVHLLRSSIPSAIEVNYHVEQTNLMARIEPVHLHQILLNLAINSRDAIDEHGRIDVSLTRKSVAHVCDSCHAPFDGAYVEIVVRDTGRGIPDSALANIFDPFFTTREMGKGSGMGLSVVHGLVHALEGHIVVESKPGLGTTMRILLPEANDGTSHDDATRISMPVAAERMLEDMKIMVIDDEVPMSSMLKELLSMYGAQVTAYNLPVDALAAFERDPNQFDLVITDETMPDISGLDMAKGMLQLRPTLPVILSTGHSEHVNADIAKQNGIACFMPKPLDVPKLLHAVRQFKPTAISS